jgi:hypothetical protein
LAGEVQNETTTKETTTTTRSPTSVVILKYFTLQGEDLPPYDKHYKQDSDLSELEPSNIEDVAKLLDFEISRNLEISPSVMKFLRNPPKYPKLPKDALEVISTGKLRKCALYKDRNGGTCTLI